MMEEKKLKFAKNRAKEAPLCPCGQDNKHNAAFAPFADCEGKAGHCHRCGQTFMPDDTPEIVYTYTAPPKVKQQFVPEPEGIGKKLIDTVLGQDKDGIRTVTFYYRNIAGKLTSAKSMDYHKDSFKRVKEHHPTHLFLRDSGYYACLFNEHALTKYPHAIVILVESEKTAGIMTTRIDAEQFIFLGTGGTNALTDDKISVLKGREVWICFDCDQGESQPDGTILKPKGREAAQAAYLKLVPICSAVKVIDLDPDLNDGTDLCDLPRETITLDYLRSLPTTTRTPIPAELIAYLRQLNRDGLVLTDEKIQELGQNFGINGDRILTLNRSVIDQYSKETNLTRSPINERIKHWLSSKYEFRRNVITHIPSMRSPGTQWQKLNTATLWDEINCDSKSVGKGKKGGDITIARTTIDNLMESSFVPDYNPLKEYFENLPPWDGEDHILKLAEHVQTDNQDFWLIQFRRALVRSIACSLYGQVNRVVVVLVSEKQHLGKSEFIRHLCPPELRDLYKEEPWVHNNKDSEIALSQSFIWNLEELDNLNKGEISAMKAVISRQSVNQRRAYQRDADQMPRIVNFWSSTNKTDFLTDVENTRWLPFIVKTINHDYCNTRTGAKTVEIDKVWAQAWALYHKNYDYSLTAEEQIIQSRVNTNFESMTEEKELIIKHFKPGRSHMPGSLYMSNGDIRFKLEAVSKTNLSIHNIGRSMKQLGFEGASRRVDEKTVRGYWVIFSDRGWDYSDSAPSQIEIPLDPPF